MSTGAVIAIIVIVVIILLLLAVVLPRMRTRRAQHRRDSRRSELAGAHREAAEEQDARARAAERMARRAEAEAELHKAQADLHDRGLADDELDRDGDVVRRGEAQRPASPQEPREV
jgi:predicted Holliday junction resolvase-like endonuclease